MDQKTLITFALITGLVVLVQGWRKMQIADSGIIRLALSQGAKVIDVRSPEEFAGRHYPSAVNIPLHLIGITPDVVGVEKDQTVVLYCASGMRSAQACRILRAAGYSHVLNAGSLGNLPER